jgi:hypothetical protein
MKKLYQKILKNLKQVTLEIFKSIVAYIKISI